MNETIEKFITNFSDSIAQGTFIKLSLANYKGTDEQLQKITVRPVETKRGARLLFQYRGKTNDQTRNFDPQAAVEKVNGYLNTGFRSGHLFTVENDHQIIIGKRSAKITIGKPTFKALETRSHDRAKHYIVDIEAPYLRALGITADNGRVRADQQDKWKQINKFIEILDTLYESSDLKNNPTLSIIDMGSGKGYLTFAAYDHFSRKFASRVSSPHANNGLEDESAMSGEAGITVTGVESRPYLVRLCNEIADACGYDGLRFIQGDIAGFDVQQTDILIALHACDTATDDALFKGIEAKSSVIVAAPCCHKQIRKQLKSPDMLAGILKHPVMLERTAETITDGLRSLLLEREGYRTKLFEFVSSEHTPKNNMLVAVNAGKRDPTKTAEIGSITEAFGITSQRLLDHLNGRP